MSSAAWFAIGVFVGTLLTLAVLSIIGTRRW